jgi:hypothetical protein
MTDGGVKNDRFFVASVMGEGVGSREGAGVRFVRDNVVVLNLFVAGIRAWATFRFEYRKRVKGLGKVSGVRS